jgi:hypothetical protein
MDMKLCLLLDLLKRMKVKNVITTEGTLIKIDDIKDQKILQIRSKKRGYFTVARTTFGWEFN